MLWRPVFVIFSPVAVSTLLANDLILTTVTFDSAEI